MKRFIIEREIEGANEIVHSASWPRSHARPMTPPRRWASRTTGSPVTLPATRCSAFTRPTTRRPSVSIRAVAAFRPTSSPRWPPSSVRRPPMR